MIDKKGLKKIVTKWQKRMRLTDWDITIDWCSVEQLSYRIAEDGDEPDPDKFARISEAVTDSSNPWQANTSSLEHRKTRILLKRDAFSSDKDVESAIIHELLHTLLWALAPNDEDASGTITLEQIINTLETMLINGETKDGQVVSRAKV